MRSQLRTQEGRGERGLNPATEALVMDQVHSFMDQSALMPQDKLPNEFRVASWGVACNLTTVSHERARAPTIRFQIHGFGFLFCRPFNSKTALKRTISIMVTSAT